MAKCEYCGLEMLTADGCRCAYYGDPKVKRIKYGEEWPEAVGRCHDCGALLGHYHHPDCDVELCPVCGMQAIMCECNLDYVYMEGGE